jgi:hypothetical protein
MVVDVNAATANCRAPITLTMSYQCDADAQYTAYSRRHARHRQVAAKENKNKPVGERIEKGYNVI